MRLHHTKPFEQEDLKDYYSAADALVLASSREGIANVLLEAMISACGATHVGFADDWDMLVVGEEPSRRALSRAAREGIAVIGEHDLVAVHRFVQRHSERVDSTSAEALERARAEGRALEAARRSVLSPRQVQDVASRLADVAKERQTGTGGGMHTVRTTGRRHAA